MGGVLTVRHQDPIAGPDELAEPVAEGLPVAPEQLIDGLTVVVLDAPE